VKPPGLQEEHLCFASFRDIAKYWQLRGTLSEGCLADQFSIAKQQR
jgi:hypothetical protein